ncbi:MAG: hypothetical protein H0V53_07885 [Rubrobacter sp.]|nr:hypothetical protein [Rubrobacter sp.]
MDSVVILVVVAVVAVVAGVLLAGFVVSRRRREQGERQEQARQEYGPEYERAVEESGSERKAEEEIRERRERVEGEVQPLPDESRRRYAEEWESVEKTFVDDPAKALDEADRVVAEIMSERNFPTDSREEASKGLGVMHSDVAEDFRKAQEVHAEAAGSSDGEDLEKMRRAIQEYRSVYERLTEG